jgi:hypothetical protein
MDQTSITDVPAMLPDPKTQVQNPNKIQDQSQYKQKHYFKTVSNHYRYEKILFLLPITTLYSCNEENSNSS